jgi:hypothetical protein
MGRTTIQAFTAGDSVATAFPAMKALTSYEVKESGILVGAMLSCAITASTVTTPIAVGIGIADNTNNTNAVGGVLLIPPLLFLASVSGQPQNIVFGGGAGLPVNAGQRLVIYGSSENASANKLAVSATFYIDPPRP